jgi:sigma-B regulation protein RsbU (phosphoserine phosphatase)
MTSEMSQINTLKVRWFSSISFKIFCLVAFFLAICVGVVTWQQTGILSDFLHRQLEDSTLLKSRDIVNDTEKALERWENTLNLIGTRMAGSTIESYADFLSSFMQSDKFIATFEMVSIQSDGSVKSLIFSENPRFALNLNEKKEELKHLFSVNMAPQDAEDDRLEIINFRDKIDIPLIGLSKRFKIEGQSQELRAFLTLHHHAIFGLENDDLPMGIFVFGKNNNILYTKGDSLLTDTKILNQIQKRISEKNRVNGLSSDFSDGDVNQMLLAIDEVSEFGLRIAVVQNASGARLAIRKTLIQTLLWVILAVLIAIFVSYLVSFSMTRTLIKTSELTQKIAGGDFNSRVVISGKDEVASLAQSVNRMAGQIRELLVARIAAARQEKELETAKLVQESFFPRADLNSERIKVKGICYPASECGGDLWGYFPITDQLHYFFIADATGHGVSAALVTAMAYIEWHAIVIDLKDRKKFVSPAMLLERLNNIFVSSGSFQTTMTMFIGCIELEKGIITVANAGHNFPFQMALSNKKTTNEDSKGTQETSDKSNDKKVSDQLPKDLTNKNTIKKIMCRGTPLGFQAGMTYSTEEINIGEGTKIFAYTDGLFECQNESGAPWGENRLRRAIKDGCDLSAEELNKKVSEQAFNHFGNQPRADDVTVLVIEISPPLSQNLETLRNVS